MFETNYLGGTGRVHLSSVIFAATITEIGVGAFCGVGYLTGELVLPTNLESIGDGAFNYCGYNSVTIPANVSYIGIDSFANMSNLSEININAINANDIPLNSYGEPEGVFFRSGSSAGITVIFGEGVIRVPANLFYDINPPTIVSLTISSTITEIGDNAFSYCDDLNTVSFSGNSQLATIGENAFVGCTSLTSFTIPSSVTLIKSGAFNLCSSLSSVTFQDRTTWRVYTSETASSAYATISSSTLSNTATAARYLTSTYQAYYWRKS